MKIITKIFNSFSELESFISSSPRVKGNEKRTSSEDISDDYFKFSDTMDYSQAAEFLRSGYTYGCESLQKEMTGLAKNYKNVVTVKNDVFGVVPNIGAYMTGHPKNMINIKTEKRAVKTKVINMVINTSVSARYTKDDIVRLGAATLLQIIRLERNGFKVNLYVASKTEYKGNKSICFTKVKNSSENLNLLKIAYPIVHPSFHRRHMFAVLERTIKIDDGYGYPELIDSQDLPVSLNSKNTIIFNYREAPRNVEGINEHLRKAISKVIK